MEDHQIVALFEHRAEIAVEETAKKYGALCHQIAYRILDNREDAAEIVNDTYLRLWNTIPPQTPKSLKAYAAVETKPEFLTGLVDAVDEFKRCCISSTPVNLCR